MSYDLSIGEESFNLTYNVSDILCTYNPDSIRMIYGLTGKEAAWVLFNLNNYLIREYDKLVKLNPTNGWGSLDNTIMCITKMMLTSINNPLEIWRGD